MRREDQSVFCGMEYSFWMKHCFTQYYWALLLHRKHREIIKNLKMQYAENDLEMWMVPIQACLHNWAPLTFYIAMVSSAAEILIVCSFLGFHAGQSRQFFPQIRSLELAAFVVHLMIKLGILINLNQMFKRKLISAGRGNETLRQAFSIFNMG